jgi:predicted XRE-type DNA-binding protein
MKNANEYRSVTELANGLKVPAAESRRIEIRTDLVVGIQRAIEKQKLTHAAAATQTGVGRTVITALMNGNSSHVSTDRLIHIAQQLGLKVTLKVA